MPSQGKVRGAALDVWELDYIFALLDEEEQAAVDALLHKVATDSGRVLAPVGGSL